MSILLAHYNPTNQMMGQILVNQQWVTPTQLGQALTEQKRTNEKLGAILVRLGFLSDMDLNFILSQQKGNTLTGESDEVKQRLGDILRKSKRLSQRELTVAVDEQKRTNEKLGEVLLRLGLLDQSELDAVLAWQGGFNSGDPMAVRLLLGEILIASKRLTRKQLSEALEHQRLTKKQIGQVLLDCGFVNKFDIRNALTIQSKMVAAGLLAMTAAMSLTGCGTPTVPTTPNSLTYASYNQIHKRVTPQVDMTGNRRVASLPGGRQLMIFNDNAHVIQNVPFFKQNADNTCAQVTTSVLLNYWGIKQDYQQLVNEQNRLNTATHFNKIVETLNAKGLTAKAYRQGSVKFLHHLVDQGKPAIALLEYNNDLFQQHYIVVVGYNAVKGTIIFHDSIDGPYRELDEDEFTEMWQSKHLANLPVFGGANFQGLIIEASK